MVCLRIRCSKCGISFSTVRALMDHRDSHNAGAAAGTDAVAAVDAMTGSAAEQRDTVAVGASR
jgi:hypothetical protein